MEIEPDVRRLVDRPDVAEAVNYIREHDEATLSTQIALSEIPAPPFHERERGEHIRGLFTSAGLTGPRKDAVGNVIAERPGASTSGALVVSAHLDTVFPTGTDVTVTRDGPLLRGPGISDDARGLASIVSIARALERAGLRTSAPLLFVATVGEEGLGDLRGVKRLFGDGGRAARASAFISLDGAGLERVVANGLGSRRYRIVIDGPGGHSWVDWGAPNPAHALMTLGTRLMALELGADPVTTLTIARVGGGKSINAIPQRAWLEVDTRSPDNDALDRLERSLRRAVLGEEERQAGLDYRVEVIGDRPGGSTGADSALIRAAVAATRLLGREPRLALSSTDANVPMALGVPAVALGCGGEAGKAHTTDEWYRNTDGPDGIVRALYTILLYAGLEDD